MLSSIYLPIGNKIACHSKYLILKPGAKKSLNSTITKQESQNYAEKHFLFESQNIRGSVLVQYEKDVRLLCTQHFLPWASSSHHKKLKMHQH